MNIPFLTVAQKGQSQISLPKHKTITEKEAIEAYFNSGFSYNAILCFLEKYHDIIVSRTNYDDMLMSLSTLKRRPRQQHFLET